MTLGDWRVLEFSTASLLVSMLTVVYLLRQPALRLLPHETSDLADPSRRTYLDTALLYLRHLPTPTGSDSPEGKWSEFLRHLPRLVFSSTVIFGVFFAQPWTAGLAVGSMKPFLFGSCEYSAPGIPRPGVTHVTPGSCRNASPPSSFSLSDVEHLPGNYLHIFMKETTNYTYQVLCIRPRQVLLRRVAVIPIGFVAWGLIFHAMFFCLAALSPLWDIYMLIAQTKEVVEQLVMIAAWPTDRECPLLWSDPKANFMASHVTSLRQPTRVQSWVGFTQKIGITFLRIFHALMVVSRPAFWTCQ